MMATTAQTNENVQLREFLRFLIEIMTHFVKLY